MCVCVHARAHVHMCMCACIQGKMRKEEKKEEKKVCVGQWVCIWMHANIYKSSFYIHVYNSASHFS